MQIKLGITGGIGSGKSVVARCLSNHGIPVYDSDSEAKRLMITDSVIKEKLTALLGPDVYSEGNLNKRFLATYLFGSEENAARVNKIVHPRVKEDFIAWYKLHESCHIVALESAILFEVGFHNIVDKTLMVYAPRDLRLERAMTRDKASRLEIERRMDNQMNDERKRLLSDFTIVNDGIIPLLPQVITLVRSL